MLPMWREAAIDKSHDRKGFDCGQPDLNAFLAQYARKAHENSISKTYVAVDAEDGKTIYGFYTLSPAQVEFHRIPEIAQPAGGRYPVGGFRLARLAVSRHHQGHGLGGQLLVAAAVRCLRASAEVGGTTLIIDAKDERAVAWYGLFGAVPLRDAPLTLLLPYNLLRQALAAADKPIF